MLRVIDCKSGEVKEVPLTGGRVRHWCIFQGENASIAAHLFCTLSGRPGGNVKPLAGGKWLAVYEEPAA